MDTAPHENPFGSCPLPWLEREDVARLIGCHERTVTRLSKTGAMPGTEGRGLERYSHAFPIFDTPRFREWLARHCQMRATASATVEKLARAKAAGKRVTHSERFQTTVDNVKVALWEMTERGTARLAPKELVDIEEALHEVGTDMETFRRLIASRMMQAGIQPRRPHAYKVDRS